jgi:hypothetical protein
LYLKPGQIANPRKQCILTDAPKSGFHPGNGAIDKVNILILLPILYRENHYRLASSLLKHGANKPIPGGRSFDVGSG